MSTCPWCGYLASTRTHSPTCRDVGKPHGESTMNNQQRKQLNEVFKSFDWLTSVDGMREQMAASSKPEADAWSVIDDGVECVKDAIQCCLDEEQEKFDNMPESLQSGSKGDTMQEGIDTLESAVSDLEISIPQGVLSDEDLDEICDAVSNAIGNAQGI